MTRFRRRRKCHVDLFPQGNRWLLRVFRPNREKVRSSAGARRAYMILLLLLLLLLQAVLEFITKQILEKLI